MKPQPTEQMEARQDAWAREMIKGLDAMHRESALSASRRASDPPAVWAEFLLLQFVRRGNVGIVSKLLRMHPGIDPGRVAGGVLFAMAAYKHDSAMLALLTDTLLARQQTRKH